MKLTEHFSLEELTQTGKNATNKPNIEQLENLKMLAEKVLEPARELYGKPIRVTSGFRSEVVNRLVGGSRTSSHLANNGQAAADLQCENNQELFDLIKDYLEFDQLIYEFSGPTGPAWVHVGYKKKGNRGQVLQAIKVGSRTTYLPYKL